MALAIKFAERRLRPYMRSDETITEYDIADVHSMGHGIPVVLTQRAVYFVNNLRSIRVPYEHIFDLQSRGKQMVGFSTKSGNAFLIQIQGTPKGDMYKSIAKRLKEDVVKHQQLVEIPQGTVVAVCRRIEEDGDYVWTWRPSEGVSLESELVRAALEREVGPVARELDVPFPWYP